MKKTLLSLAVIIVLGFSATSLKADDGELNHGTRSCTPTAEQPCPEAPPQNSQANGESGDQGWFESALQYLGVG